MEKVEDFTRWAEKMAALARQGVQVERLWQQKLEADRKAELLARAS